MREILSPMWRSVLLAMFRLRLACPFNPFTPSRLLTRLLRTHSPALLRFFTPVLGRYKPRTKTVAITLTSHDPLGQQHLSLHASCRPQLQPRNQAHCEWL